MLSRRCGAALELTVIQRKRLASALDMVSICIDGIKRFRLGSSCLVFRCSSANGPGRLRLEELWKLELGLKLGPEYTLPQEVSQDIDHFLKAKLLDQVLRDSSICKDNLANFLLLMPELSLCGGKY